MAEIVDVAEYILGKLGTITALKLQKLCYYSQAWHLVWEEKALFDNEIQAWANGPVSPRLYSYHRQQFSVSPGSIGGDASNLDADESSTVDSIIKFYGTKSSMELSELTHAEAPWKDARGNTPMGARSNEVISQASMAEYYSSL